MTIDQIRELYRDGHVIAAHGDCHRNDMDDIMRGIEKLRAWGVAGNRIGFASPNSDISYDEIYRNEKQLRDIGVEYVRVGIPPDSMYRRGLRLGAKITHNCLMFRHGLAWNSMDNARGFIIHSIPVMRYATVEQVIDVIRWKARQNQPCTLMFHSILKPEDKHYDDTWSWDCTSFEELCEWIGVSR